MTWLWFKVARISRGGWITTNVLLSTSRCSSFASSHEPRAESCGRNNPNFWNWKVESLSSFPFCWTWLFIFHFIRRRLNPLLICHIDLLSLIPLGHFWWCISISSLFSIAATSVVVVLLSSPSNLFNLTELSSEDLLSTPETSFLDESKNADDLFADSPTVDSALDFTSGLDDLQSSPPEFLASYPSANE